MLLFARLIGAILLEGLVSVLQIVVFLFRRQSERARVHDLILGRRAAVAAVGVILMVTLCLQPGCGSFRGGEGLPPDPDSSVRVGGSFPGSSFGKQVDELFWSTEELLGMPDARGSLEEDLQDLGASDPEALRETMEMLGW